MFFVPQSAIPIPKLDSAPCPHHIMNGFRLAKKVLHLAEGKHAGGIAERPTRFGMGLEEKAIAARGHSGPGEMGHKLRASPSWVLARDTVIPDDMGRVEDHGAADLLHDRDRTDVRNEFIIAETGSSLREKDLIIPCAANLLDRSSHIFRG